MREYPVITHPNGYYIVIGGFLVSLKTRDPRRLEVKAADNFAIEDRLHIQNICHLDSLQKMAHMKSNYFLTNHVLLFRLLRAKTFVSFVRQRGKYYCRRTDKNRATHVAFTIDLPREKKNTYSKYVVYERSLKELTSKVCGPQQQQYDDLRSFVYKNRSCPEIAEAHTAVKHVSEGDFLEVADYLFARPISSPVEKSSKENHLLKLMRLKDAFLEVCHQRSLCKLSALRRVLLEIPNANGDAIDKLYEQCKESVRSNLSLVNEKTFLTLFYEDLQRVRSYNATFERLSKDCMSVNELLMDLHSKIILDSKEDIFLSKVTDQERVPNSELSSRKILRSSEGRSALEADVIDSANIELVERHKRKDIGIQGINTDYKSTLTERQSVSIILRDMETNHSHGNVETFISKEELDCLQPGSKDLHTSSLEYLGLEGTPYRIYAKRFRLFSGYEEQQKLYLDTYNWLRRKEQECFTDIQS